MKSALWPAMALLLSACAGTVKPNVSVQRAEAAMQRAAQAYARGELDASRRTYLDALRVYESLADAEGRARALLSLARVTAAAGKPAAALATVDGLLAESDALTPALRTLAHGRGAGLALSTGQTEAAQRHLDAARATCADKCPESDALIVLAARLALARGQTESAWTQADGLLARIPGDSRSTHRADALRLRAEASMGLGRSRDAMADVQAALGIDQRNGLAEAVILDLDLLARLHSAAGEADLGARQQALAERARAARRTLLGLDRGD
jgi:tetratricopeptide (TPR) repeat protein